MSRWRRAAACVSIVVSLAAGRSLAAQSLTLAVSNLKADSMSPAPNMTLTAVQVRPDLGPYTVSLELSTEPGFQRPFYIAVDTGQAATFTIDSLLPEATVIYFRARLNSTSKDGLVVAEVIQQHPVRRWLGLVEPAQRRLVPLTTRKPRFIWSSPPITLPPGLWEYDLTVTSTLTGQPAFFAPGLQDTSFVFPDSLEANASYSWQVTARARNNRGTGEVTVRSVGTFVISSSDKPTFTLFYQNFPNPFGRGQRVASTCFWFDLARDAKVQLTIYDLRLRLVRHIIPGQLLTNNLLVAGIYGRDEKEMTGCDKQLEWDGRDDSGRFVPEGVYIAEFRADGQRTTKKVYFKGQP